MTRRWLNAFSVSFLARAMATDFECNKAIIVCSAILIKDEFLVFGEQLPIAETTNQVHGMVNFGIKFASRKLVR